MPATWNNLKQTAQNMVLEPAPPAPMTAEAQTRLSWSRQVETYEQVPAAYLDFFAALQRKDEPMPYTVLSPSLEGFLRPRREKLICRLKGQVAVLEKTRDGCRATTFPREGIAYMESGKVLLRSWLHIHGCTTTGEPAAAEIGYNTANDYLFTPLVNWMRAGGDQAAKPVNDPDLDAEREKFTYLMNVNYKFMNYARNCLLPGQRVQAMLYQPEVRAPMASLLGRTFYRVKLMPHLAILTGEELILIQEPVRSLDKKFRYGGRWIYIPRDKVQGMNLRPADDDLLELSLTLAHEETLSLRYEVERGAEVRQFAADVDSL